ncbi:hypothetical protein SLE2022_071650 [Rubroshorea leprosula]
MSTFPDSFTQPGDESVVSVLHDDGYGGYGGSHGLDSITNDSGSVKDSANDIFESQPSIQSNMVEFDGEFGESDGPTLPPPFEMEPEEGFAIREWRRQNAIVLEEKEKREKELLSQIIEEAEEYKVEFYKKREITCENNKSSNREKEKLFVANVEKFYAEADKDYWKAIADLIPMEVPAIEKKRGKKDEEKKPSILVVQGPKPGKPTDLTRMRQLLLKLKQNTPPHLKHSPQPVAEPPKDAKTSTAAAAASPVTTTSEAVVAA